MLSFEALLLAMILFFVVAALAASSGSSSGSSNRSEVKEFEEETNQNLKEEYQDDEYLEEAPELDRIKQVATNYEDDDPIIKPIFGLKVDADEEPDPSEIYPYIHRILEITHPSFWDQRRCYEFQVGHGEGVHQVKIGPGLAEMVCQFEDFSPEDLQEKVDQQDRRDPDREPIYWRKIREPSDSSGAVVAAAGGAAASAGACGGAAGGGAAGC